MWESHQFDREQLVSHSPFSPQVALCGNGALRGAELLATWHGSPPFCTEHNSDNHSSSLVRVLFMRSLEDPFFFAGQNSLKWVTLRLETAHLRAYRDAGPIQV